MYYYKKQKQWSLYDTVYTVPPHDRRNMWLVKVIGWVVDKDDG